MPRIHGVDIPVNKKTLYALTYIKGIGRSSAAAIIAELSLDQNKKAKDLTEDEIGRITVLMDKEYLIEGELKRRVSDNIKRLKDIGVYRGVRHARGLPVRGQSSRR
ncbi:MAG TPA: 30S ribosomal protein S13, partial [Candidatus Saccharimonadales bacterium]